MNAINNYKWEEVLKYDENSKSCLRWLSGPRKGKEAGCVDKDSRGKDYFRYRIVAFGKHWLAHRIIWVLLKGYLEDIYEIDHIDGNSLNNLEENLRKVVRETNTRNNRKRRDNSSGHTGVYTCETGYRAGVKINGKEKTKFFSYLKFGNARALELAIEWRTLELMKLKQIGLDYTERHGQ